MQDFNAATPPTTFSPACSSSFFCRPDLLASVLTVRENLDHIHDDLGVLFEEESLVYAHYYDAGLLPRIRLLTEDVFRVDITRNGVCGYARRMLPLEEQEVPPTNTAPPREFPVLYLHPGRDVVAKTREEAIRDFGPGIIDRISYGLFPDNYLENAFGK